MGAEANVSNLKDRLTQGYSCAVVFMLVALGSTHRRQVAEGLCVLPVC